MTVDHIERKLLDAGLHEESVKRLIGHYQSMQLRLRQGNYEEVGTHIGKFCENMTNILANQMGQPVQSNPVIHQFVTNCENGSIGTTEPDEIRLGVARMLRATYDIRNNRDTVHVNLEVPVNQADSQTGVRMCSWMLAEVLRVYGAGDNDMDDVAELIEELSTPATSYIDEYRGDRMVQHNGLGVREEILIHLHALSGKDVNVDELVSWIPDRDSRSVKRSLSHMKNDRLVWYDNDDGAASITSLGMEEAEQIIRDQL